MADQIKTGPSIPERAFTIFEKSWQMVFMLYWFYPMIQTHFYGPTPVEENPVEPIPVSWE